MVPYARPHGTMVTRQLLRRGDVCAAYNVLGERLPYESATARAVLMRNIEGRALVDGVTRGSILRQSCSTMQMSSAKHRKRGRRREVLEKCIYSPGFLDFWMYLLFLLLLRISTITITILSHSKQHHLKSSTCLPTRVETRCLQRTLPEFRAPR